MQLICLLQGLLCLPLGLLIYYSESCIMFTVCDNIPFTRCPPRHGHSLMLLTVTLCYFLLKCSSWTVKHLTGVFSRTEMNCFKILVFTYHTDIKIVYGDNWSHSDLDCYSNVHGNTPKHSGYHHERLKIWCIYMEGARKSY